VTGPLFLCPLSPCALTLHPWTPRFFDFFCRSPPPLCYLVFLFLTFQLCFSRRALPVMKLLSASDFPFSSTGVVPVVFRIAVFPVLHCLDLHPYLIFSFYFFMVYLFSCLFSLTASPPGSSSLIFSSFLRALKAQRPPPLSLRMTSFCRSSCFMSFCPLPLDLFYDFRLAG